MKLQSLVPRELQVIVRARRDDAVGDLSSSRIEAEHVRNGLVDIGDEGAGIEEDALVEDEVGVVSASSPAVIGEDGSTIIPHNVRADGTAPREAEDCSTDAYAGGRSA